MKEIFGLSASKAGGSSDASSVVDDWRPIATAPRDGTVVRLRSDDDDVEIYEMRWNPAGTSWCQRGQGIWEHPSGELTWSEERGFGPTHWAPLSATQDASGDAASDDAARAEGSPK